MQRKSANFEGAPNTKLSSFAQNCSDAITTHYLNSTEILLDEILNDVGGIGKFVGINRVPISVLDILSLPSKRCVIVHTP